MIDDILPIPAITDGLREASQRGVLIPFIGAGVSRLAGCPTWAELADGALRECIAANKFTYGQLAQIQHLSPRVKLSIARGLEAQHSLQIDYGTLINPRGGYEKHEVGNLVYRSLGKLGSTFVTTNYDSWLDIEIPEARTSITASAAAQDTTAAAPTKRNSIYKVAEFTPANLNQAKTVFHLHGSLADPTGMVMTTRDYITRYANDRGGDDPKSENRTLTFLSHLFQEKTVLFIGYGLEDLEILEYVIQKGRMAAPGQEIEARHYMLQGYFSHELELMRSLSQYYMQTAIQLIPFSLDHKDWPQLIEVIETFAELMPATKLLNLQKQKEMEAMLD
jgi:SIR2-like domain